MISNKIRPTPERTELYKTIDARDHNGEKITADIIHERPLTIFLNAQEIVTLMTIGDHPKWLAVGYLYNQNMLQSANDIQQIDYEDDIDTVVVRTKSPTNFEQKLKRKIQTSGCGQGTLFGDLIDTIEDQQLPLGATLKTNTLPGLLKTINLTPRLYLKTGAIHGCVLCQSNEPLIYMEDVGRHNAVDKIAGLMLLENIKPTDKLFYTTGRLTSEMVIKCVKMQIPILVTRSGFTAWAIELARAANLTLIGRARGKRFIALAGFERLIYDQSEPHAKQKPTLASNAAETHP